MTEYDLETKARKAIVAFLANATPDDAQAILSHRLPLTAHDAAIEAGKLDFARFGCAGCHRPELEGGLANQKRKAGRFRRFCTSPTITPRTKSSQ